MDMNRMPSGEEQTACRPMKDCGTKTGVTSDYGADISGGATNKNSGQASGDIVMPGKVRMEDC